MSEAKWYVVHTYSGYENKVKVDIEKTIENRHLDDDTWYVVRNTRGVTGFVGPGSKPVPLTEEEMLPLGIKKEEIQVDFAEGDTVVVTGGAWKDTVGVITALNVQKQTATINVELFGRETPVEISFAEIKQM